MIGPILVSLTLVKIVLCLVLNIIVILVFIEITKFAVSLHYKFQI